MLNEQHVEQPVQIVLRYEHSTLVEVLTSSPFIDHFLRKVKLSQSENTWINYAHDLKVFFTIVGLPLQQITRQTCVLFMEKQIQSGLARLTVNRRLAAISSLFQELHLLDPDQFTRNPVIPISWKREIHKRSQGLYLKQPERIPEIISEQDLQTFFQALPSWRDRTLILLMWISCLRISEAVSLRFEDVECSNRSVHIRHGKGGGARTVYMDRFTFAALNKYLDEERQNLFPDIDEIFVAFKGKARGCPLRVNALQHAIDYYAEQCGLALHAHLFRHTGITQLVTGGMSEAAIRKFVGHRHVDSLAPYLHLGDTYVASAFEKAQQALIPPQLFPTPFPGGQS